MPVARGSVVEPFGFFVCDAVGMNAVAMASVQRLRSAGGLVFCLGAGIRGCALPARAVWLFWPLRWHPRFVFVARPVWFFAFALASAFCLRASRVAPVRGGTYFSLPPQRKVGKRKRLTPHIFLPA
ncbi:hypothetical protein [Paraburkholderia hospita]|uniref:hypothetical protein n=1 Tax=Paraburkholderia hospita TaxID=169430 RepID=UPI001178430D|nr:hypothetical protein [Paraburkholderia hospita]